MATRWSYDKSDADSIQNIMSLYLAKSRTQLATDILLSMYRRYADGHFTRQYMLVYDMPKVPKSNIRDALTDLERIRAIRNEGAKGTVSTYKPSLDQLGSSLRGHAKRLEDMHQRLLDEPESFNCEAVYSNIEVEDE